MKHLLLLIMMLNFTIYAFNQTTEYSYFGNSVSPKGELHTLIVFIGLDDASSADNYPEWDYNDLPEWAKGDYNEVFDVDDNQIHTVRNLTSYNYTMSQGTFTLTGEVYPELVIVTPEYPSSGLNISKAIQDAIDQINLQTHPTFDYDWSRFDNRKNTPAYDFDNSLYSDTSLDPAAPDGIIDYVCFVIRRTGCGGLASTGAGTKKLINGTDTLGLNTGHQINADCSEGGESKGLLQVYMHEMMHTIYSAPHTWGVNGVVGDYYYSYNGWGFMAPFQIMQCANAWERWWLNWITPQEITANGTYTLKDYLTEGDALRIPIPKTGPTETDQYLFLENHQLINYYDRKPDYTEESDPLTTGVYAFIAAKGHSRTTTINTSNPNANMFKSLNAAGRNDFTVDGYKTVDGVGGSTEEHPIFSVPAESPARDSALFHYNYVALLPFNFINLV